MKNLHLYTPNIGVLRLLTNYFFNKWGAYRTICGQNAQKATETVDRQSLHTAAGLPDRKGQHVRNVPPCIYGR